MYTQCPTFRGSNVIGQIKKIMYKIFFFLYFVCLKSGTHHIITQNIPLFPFKNSCIIFVVCFGSLCICVLWNAVQSTLLRLGESGLKVYPYTLQNSSGWRVFFSRLDVVKGFFFTMERILRLLFSVDVQAFLCCWDHQCILFFSQNVPNCRFGHSECSCYLSEGFVLI